MNARAWRVARGKYKAGTTCVLNSVIIRTKTFGAYLDRPWTMNNGYTNSDAFNQALIGMESTFINTLVTAKKRVGIAAISYPGRYRPRHHFVGLIKA